MFSVRELLLFNGHSPSLQLFPSIEYEEFISIEYDGEFRMYIDDKSNESNLIKFSLTLLNVSM